MNEDNVVKITFWGRTVYITPEVLFDETVDLGQYIRHRLLDFEVPK